MSTGEGPAPGPPRTYALVGPDGTPVDSGLPGRLGGHRRNRIYGRLGCPSALRALARGYYVEHRVFFADEPTAVAAGFRPCGTCLPDRYAVWKRRRAGRGWTTTPLLDEARLAVPGAYDEPPPHTAHEVDHLVALAHQRRARTIVVGDVVRVVRCPSAPRPG